MKRLRLHILKICTVAFICTGLLLAAVQPLQASQRNRSFSHWLQTVAQQDDETHLGERLQALNQSANLYLFIKEASRIVKENNENFNIPETSAETEDGIYQLLLVKWNQYQTGSDMAKMPAPERNKPHFTAQSDKCSVGSYPAHNYQPPSVTLLRSSILLPSFFTVNYCISPMAGGIAIGAP